MSGFLYIVGVLAFIGIWIAAFTTWGFLIGLAIGWLPAAVAGAIIFGIASLFEK